MTLYRKRWTSFTLTSKTPKQQTMHLASSKNRAMRGDCRGSTVKGCTSNSSSDSMCPRTRLARSKSGAHSADHPRTERRTRAHPKAHLKNSFYDDGSTTKTQYWASTAACRPGAHWCGALIGACMWPSDISADCVGYHVRRERRKPRRRTADTVDRRIDLG
jgi:hypothetical protein